VIKYPSILRILFALLICGGLCRQDWSHIHSDSAPERLSRDQTFEHSSYADGVVFREVFPESTGARAQHTDASPFLFDLPEGIEVPAPVLFALASVSFEQPKAGSHRGDCLKNKDPPPSRGQGLCSSVNVFNHFTLSSYDTLSFEIGRASCRERV
jgi:hypothetical protein